jgi:hypothetical protein
MLEAYVEVAIRSSLNNKYVLKKKIK